MDIAGKVAVVTGAGSGIGAALTQAFSATGARVVAADIDLAKLAEVARNTGAYPIVMDVSIEDDNIRLIEEAESHFGSIDLFCANAGIAYEGSEQSSDEEWERMWRVNFLSHVYAARHLIPRWQNQGGGYLLVTASAAGLLTNLGAAQYSITKHAAVAFAEWVAITYGDDGVRVSCLCPQGVLTPMLEQEAETSEYLLASAITPEAVAESVLLGLADERFLILPHPEVAQFELRRATDRDGWLEAMRRLRRNLRLR
jgi:NAD(P)-dependent dehydrogenase (short-subunit alcohol dehydrogenase family)